MTAGSLRMTAGSVTAAAVSNERERAGRSRDRNRFPLSLTQHGETHDLFREVVFGGKAHHVHPGASQSIAQFVLASASGFREPRAETLVVSVDVKLFGGLGVLQDHGSDVRQLHLSRVIQTDRQHLVALRQRSEWAIPTGSADEIGNDEDERSSAKGAKGGLEQRPEVR